MVNNTIVRIFQATNKQNLTQKDLDMAKKGKPYGILSNSSTKHCHKDKLH